MRDLTPELRCARGWSGGKDNSDQTRRPWDGPRRSAKPWLRIAGMHSVLLRPLLWLICVLFCVTGGNAQSTSGSLGDQVRAIATAHHGEIALFAQNLKTGQTVAISPDMP